MDYAVGHTCAHDMRAFSQSPRLEAASCRAFCSERMYFSSMREVLCPVCCRILNSGFPLSNAVVAARPNALLRIHATEAGFKAVFGTFSPG